MVSFITLSTMLNSSGENSVLLCLVPCLRDCTQNFPSKYETCCWVLMHNQPGLKKFIHS